MLRVVGDLLLLDFVFVWSLRLRLQKQYLSRGLRAARGGFAERETCNSNLPMLSIAVPLAAIGLLRILRASLKPSRFTLNLNPKP